MTTHLALRAEAPGTAGISPKRIVVGAGLVVASALALIGLADGYWLMQATQIMLYAVAILGVNLLTGYNGQVSLGHGAFFAVGGYVTAILMSHFGLPYWLALPIGGVVSGLLGVLVGMPALRLDMLYLALATFSLAVAVPQLLKNRLVEGWTGGVGGLTVKKPAPWSALGLNGDQTIFVFTLLVTAFCFFLVSGLVRGRTGRAIEAIRDHVLAADAMGIDTRRCKTAVFGMSAALTGIGGGLGAVVTQFVAPESYSFFLSITLLVGAVIGGLRSIYGAFFGAAFVVLVPNYAESISGTAAWAIYGMFLIGFMCLMPQGMAGFVRHQIQRISKARQGGKI